MDAGSWGAGLKNAISVDVEDYFQVSAFEKHISRDSWEHLPRRVDVNTERVLELFEEHSVKGTFFVLGWVAERHPTLVRRIVDSGHELASHGFSHTRVTNQDPGTFRNDIRRTKKILEDTAGSEVTGYRAPSFSIDERTLWALKELEDAGYRYSSSIYPIRHDLYGMPEAPRFPFHPADGQLLEIPVTTVQVAGKNLPCGGGGYFRLLPYVVSRWAVRRVNADDRQPCVFYFHPWEIDPEQPRQHGIGLKARFRHYVNLGRMQARLRRLLSDFEWDRMDSVFLDAPSATDGRARVPVTRTAPG